MQNDDFKYILQDTSHVYFGRELTYQEIKERDDVPFKFKAIISSYFIKDTPLTVKLTDHVLTMQKEDFSYQIYEQLKLQVRIFYAEEKKGLNGKTKQKWIHKTCSPGELQNRYADAIRDGSVHIEDASVSKLALMMISI